MMGPAPSAHVFVVVSKIPIAATASVTLLCGADEPAVDGSTTLMSLPDAVGLEEVSRMASTDPELESTTKFTMFDRVASGF